MLLEALKLFDLLVMVLAFGLAAVASYEHSSVVSFSDFLSMRIRIQNFALFFCFLVIWHGVFSLFGLYHSRRFSTRLNEATDVIRAVSVGTLVFIVASIFLNIQLATPLFFLVFYVGSCSITIIGRLVLRYILEWFRLKGRNLRHMLIVGTNRRAVEFAQKIEERPELGYKLVGFVDDPWAGMRRVMKKGYALVSDFKNFQSFLRDHVVDEVVIFLPMKSLYDQASGILALCEEQGITVRHLSNPFTSNLAQTRVDEFESGTVITLHTITMGGLPLLIKRTLDLVTASVLVLLLSPLFLLVALSIKATSPGPVFFLGERVGLNKRRFFMYKFRTMVADAEKKQVELEEFNEVSGPVFKIKNDPRITPIGKLLRETSIDELPQLVNVLKGDMSLVGPRPLPVRDYKGFDQDWHRRRFSVRPGITCLWQVNGRSDLSFEEWMKLDMQYIDQWSLWLDLKILAKTLPAVIRGAGAA
jgi:exopolysaccharide biosynthesis polyprenyl glycosylphosphotransferase